MNKTLYTMIEKARQETNPLNGWVMVTPKLAEELLKMNVNNYRSMIKSSVDRYSKEMALGNWNRNGEPIVFSEDGILRNGQNRLAAIVKSNVPVCVYMIFDASESAIYDMQSKRSICQVLKAVGYPTSTIVPSVVKAILNGMFSGNSKIGVIEACNYVIKNYDLLKRADRIVRSNGKTKLKPISVKAPCATVAYCMLKTGEITENEMIDFFKSMNSDKALRGKPHCSCAIALRKQFETYEGHSDKLNDRLMDYTYQALKDFHAKKIVDKKHMYQDDGSDVKRLVRTIKYMDEASVPAA